MMRWLAMRSRKQPVVSGILEGIKGQYPIFDNGVINMRKFTGYEIEVEAWLHESFDTKRRAVAAIRPTSLLSK